MKKLDRYFYLVLGIIFLICVIFLPRAVHDNDYGAFLRWSDQVREFGLTRAYELKSNNYFPMFNYLIYVLNTIFGSKEAIAANIYLLKIPLLAFDFASIALCAGILKKFKQPRYFALLILLNPAFFYNSLIWGQIESLYIFFTLAAIVAALYSRPNWSVALYVLAFYSKLQAIIFLPGLILLLLPQYLKKPKLFWQGLLIFVITQVIFLAPFLFAGQLGNVYSNVMTSVDLYPVLSKNAYNFWVLLFGGGSANILDSNILFIFSYKVWGMLVFCGASALALWPQFRHWLKEPKQALVPELDRVYKILLINALIALIFFYFPTQMHERYLQPAILLFGLVFLLKPGKVSGLIYALISAAYLGSLVKAMYADLLTPLMYSLLSSRLFAFIFGIVLLVAFFLLYRYRLRSPGKISAPDRT